MGEALDIRVRYRPVIEIRGMPAVDEEVASILEAIREKGSLLSTSKSLGIPYSRAWERISRIENISGRRVVEARRGGRRGGGSALTSFGEYLLTLYRIALSRLEEAGLSAPMTPGEWREGIVVAHSSDPLLSLILERLSSQGIPVKGVCIGSGLSLAMLSLGEADVACAHLYDPRSGEYNRPYFERLWLSDRVERLGGYYRELVLAFRRGLGVGDLEKAVEGILRGLYRVAMRNRGSGTMVYMEHLLSIYSSKLGIGFVDIKTGEELYTHDEVCEAIASGRADIGLTLRYSAEKHGLQWIHAAWEGYECHALRDRTWKIGVEGLRRLLSQEVIRGVAEVMPGYRAEG